MKKKLPLKRLKKKADVVLKTKAKERDNYICQRCERSCEKSNAHGSHVIPVSAGNRLRWDLQNIKCLCFHCHINFWHKNPLEAADWFKNKFPDRWKYLQEQRLKGFKKYTIEDLQNLIKENA